MKKKIVEIIVVIGFAFVFMIPILMMKKLSQIEVSQYEQYDEYNFREVAYGAPCQVKRENIKEFFLCDGVITSDTYEFIMLDQYKSDDVKTFVGEGDEVCIGQVVAKAGWQVVKSQFNGLIEEVISGRSGYIKIRSLDQLKLICMVKPQIADKLKSCKTLKLENNSKLTIDVLSNVVTDNMVKAKFQVESKDFHYGQKLEKLKIYTGVEYQNILVVKKDCVYQKTENGPYFVRVINDQLVFLYEKEVKIGFETEELISVTNIEEGSICDSGYKILVEMNKENQK